MSNTETERTKALRNIGPSSIVTVDNVPAEDVVSLKVYVDPMQDLHGYDHPWPAGGGKNLLPSGANRESKGITFTVNSDGTVKVTGTASALTFWGVQFTIPAGTYILNGCPANGSANSYYMDISNNVGGSGISGISADTGRGTTFTLTGSLTAYVNIRIASGYVCPSAGLLFKPMIRLASVADDTYAPYSNICPISGWTGANVTRTGKNLFDKTATDTDNGYVANKYVGTSGTLVSDSDCNISEYIKAKPSQDYIVQGVSGSNISVAFYDSSKTFISAIGYRIRWGTVGNKAFTTPANCEYIRLSIVKANINITMLEFGSTASTYEAFTGNTTHSITFPTEAGTVYGGTLDVTKGTLTVTMAEVDLGTLKWVYIETQYHAKRYYTTSLHTLIRAASSNSIAGNLICSAFVNKSANYGFAGLYLDCVTVDTAETVSIYPSTEYTSANDFRTAMSGVQLVYELATPITYQLTPTQITLLAGVNNVWADCGDILKMRYWSYDLLLNKVVYDNNTLIDLTGDTITPEVMLAGYTAHDATGSEIEGNIEIATMAEVQTYFGLS